MDPEVQNTALDAIHEEEKRAGRGERRARAAEEVQLPQHVGAIGSRGWLNFGAAGSTGTGQAPRRGMNLKKSRE